MPKAFDGVNLAVLANTLNRYAIRDVSDSLINSYLAHRKRYATINYPSSLVKEVNVEMPQGSISGPLLFLLYINQSFEFNETVTIVEYAGDLALFVTGPDVDTKEAYERIM